jgi:hypothetical protein
MRDETILTTVIADSNSSANTNISSLSSPSLDVNEVIEELEEVSRISESNNSSEGEISTCFFHRPKGTTALAKKENVQKHIAAITKVSQLYNAEKIKAEFLGTRVKRGTLKKIVETVTSENSLPADTIKTIPFCLVFGRITSKVFVVRKFRH